MQHIRVPKYDFQGLGISAISEHCFAFATGKHDEINLVCKVTRFKKVLVSAE